MMLSLPEKGFGRSVKAHNVELDALCDWIEGSVAFTVTRISQSELVDVLCENNIYASQDMASARLGDAWAELRRRAQLLETGCPFALNGPRIDRTMKWRANAAYAFCLMVSLQAWYKAWAREKFGDDFRTQGELFERLTEEALAFDGWETHRTGWSQSKPDKIAAVVAGVAEHIVEDERPESIPKWTKEEANEAGLDVVCSRPFGDNRAGRPLYFVQCASGANWNDKLHTPVLSVWDKLIDFANKPQKAFALPFALLEAPFRHTALRVEGMILDRYRLLRASATGNVGWPSKALVRDLVLWLAPRVKVLPTLDD